jgi:hypothetical protein
VYVLALSSLTHLLLSPPTSLSLSSADLQR